MIPADLLAQLREKDPELWEKLQDNLEKLKAYQEGQVYKVDVIATFECLPQISGWILQGLLQEAIRARGWLLEQSTFTASPTAKIWKKTDPAWMTYSAAGGTEAEALLRAYLAALEATE